MTAATIHELDQFETKCIDLARFGDIKNAEGFDEAMKDKAFAAQVNYIKNNVEEHVTPGQMRGWLDKVQGLQDLAGRGEDAVMNIVPDKDMIDGPDSGASLKNTIRDKVFSWVDGIKAEWDSATSATKEVVAEVSQELIEEGQYLGDGTLDDGAGAIIQHNNEMENAVAEANDVPKPPGM